MDRPGPGEMAEGASPQLGTEIEAETVAGSAPWFLSLPVTRVTDSQGTHRLEGVTAPPWGKP